MSSRRERGLNQSLFLVETMPVIDEYTRKYAVMGTTGNVYTVTISETPQCTCPDYLTRRNTCKHIYFVLLKVMKTSKAQQSFSKPALQKMFENIPSITSNLIVNAELKVFYRQTTGEYQQEVKEGTVKQQEINDICPICLEDLTDGNKIDYCKYGCGKNIHENCFNMWGKKNDRICPFCRKNWEKNPKVNNFSSSYVNLYEGVGQERPENDYDDHYYYWKKRSRRSWNYRYYDSSDSEEHESESEDKGLNRHFNINRIRNNVSSVSNVEDEEDFTKDIEAIEMVYENLNKTINNIELQISNNNMSVKKNLNNSFDEIVTRKPKARNAYMIYCSQMRSEVIQKENLSGRQLISRLGELWRKMDSEEKKIYQNKEKEELEKVKIFNLKESNKHTQVNKSKAGNLNNIQESDGKNKRRKKRI